MKYLLVCLLSTCFLNSYAQAIPPEHLLLHLKFDGGQYLDKSIYEHTVSNKGTHLQDGLSFEGVIFEGNDE